MLYRLLFIFVCLSFLPGQSIFNRWLGTDPFTGSAQSTAMGSTHLLNSSGSSNARFNPANLALIDSNFEINLQIDRFSAFERRSYIMLDDWAEFLLYGDYVANEFSYYGLRGGLSVNTNILDLGRVGLGFHYAPLTHFTYHYSEEVRGKNDAAYGEVLIRDPIVGYQNLRTDGTFMVSSLGGGLQLNIPGDITLSVGAALNIIPSAEISERVWVDTLYEDVANLSTYPTINQTDTIPLSDFIWSPYKTGPNFITLSTKLNLKSKIEIAASWESDAALATTPYEWSIDSTSGLLQYWDHSTYEDSTFYAVTGINYIKPEIRSLAIKYMANPKKIISISFEMNEVLYTNHLILKNYHIYKFGFEYITPMGNPIRGGLVYRTAFLPAMSPVSMFTFGTGKNMGNLIIDVAGTYCFQSFQYPDLFPIEDDIRPDYDLVRDSKLHLQLDIRYKF